VLGLNKKILFSQYPIGAIAKYHSPVNKALGESGDK